MKKPNETQDRQFEATQQFDVPPEKSPPQPARTSSENVAADQGVSASASAAATPLDVTVSQVEANAEQSSVTPDATILDANTQDRRASSTTNIRFNRGSDDKTSASGTNWFGRFVLLEQLGSGAKGDLHRALHSRLHKTTVLRMIPGELLATSEDRERFQEVIGRLSRMEHPSLARLESAGQHEETPYLLMEYVAGLDLQQLVARRGPLAPPDACRLIEQALLAVAHLDDLGLSHGDLDPTRIRISATSGTAKVTDAGLREVFAGASGELQAAAVTAAPEYRPPPPLQGSIRGDVYALGRVFQFLLTGEPPQADESPSARPEVPDELWRIVRQMTSLRAEKRTDDPGALAERLRVLAEESDLWKLLAEADVVSMSGEAGRPTDSLLSGRLSSTNSSSTNSSASSPAITSRNASSHRHDPGRGPGRRWMPVAIVTGLAVLAAVGLLIHAALSEDAQPRIARSAQPDPASDDKGSASRRKTSPIGWSLPDDRLEKAPETVLDRRDDLATLLEASRDAFDCQLLHSDQGVEFWNASGRGIVQVPLVTEDTFELEATVERLEGDDSFGIGFSVPQGRLMALVDHKDGDKWLSGVAYFNAKGELVFCQQLEGRLLETGQPLRIRIQVLPSEARLQVEDPLDALAGSTETNWLTSSWQGDPSSPQLQRLDTAYPGVVFLHCFKSRFRISSLGASRNGMTLSPVDFTDEPGREQRQLAERLLWRGAGLSILEDGKERTVHRIEELGESPQIRSVARSSSSSQLAIGDQEVEALARTSRVSRLDLRGSEVTSHCLAAIDGMESLEFLGLRGDAIKGEALDQLHRLPGLRRLMLNNISLQPDDLAFLQRLPDLEVLCLSGCPVTDQMVEAHLLRLTRLQHLCLNYTPVTGSFISQLEAWPQLQELQLGHTQVDDTRLPQIAALPHLREVVLSQSRVTQAGISTLKQQRPQLEIK